MSDAAQAVTPPAATQPAPQPTTTTTTGHSAALALLKAAAVEEPSAPPAAEAAPPAEVVAPVVAEPEAEDSPRKFARLARAHQRLLAEKAAAKAEIEKERAELAASKDDIEAARAIRNGDWKALERLRGPDWYDQAVEAVIKQNHPQSAEAQIADIKAEQAKKDRAAKEAAERAVELSNKTVAEMREKNVTGFRDNSQTLIKADDRFTALRGEDAQEIAEVVWSHLERQYDSTKKTPTQDDAMGYLLRLEAAVRARNELTKPPASGTPKSGDTDSGKVVAGSPTKPASKEGATTLTAGAHGSMPVEDWRATKESRKAAALALLRAAMKEE